MAAELLFFDPVSPFKPPPPPPPPAPSWLLSGFFRLYHFSSPVSGFIPHVGATAGGRGIAVMLGGLPSEGLASVGMIVPRFSGTILSNTGAMPIGLVGPNFEMHLFSDFSDNFQVAIGGSLLGLNISTCNLGKSGPAMFAQLRLPTVHAWVPVIVNGEADPDDTNASPFLSIGAGLEVGVVFF